MKRLTIKDPHGITAVGSRYGINAKNDDLANVNIFELIDRLGKYEDIGLEPEEIITVIKLAERMNVCDLVAENLRLANRLRHVNASKNAQSRIQG